MRAKSQQEELIEATALELEIVVIGRFSCRRPPKRIRTKTVKKTGKRERKKTIGKDNRQPEEVTNNIVETIFSKTCSSYVNSRPNDVLFPGPSRRGTFFKTKSIFITRKK